MPSPFPGMDPYLEHPAVWPDVHASLIQDIRRQLVPNLGESYYARTEVELFIREPSADQRTRFARADDAILIGRDAPSAASGDTAVAERPTTRMQLVDTLLPEKLRTIEIRTSQDDRVVTVIELLSPTNKGDGRQKFVEKRARLHQAGVHFLQIDLLRAGHDLLPQEPPPGTYNALLLRVGEDVADVWMWTLRDTLPILPVPLANDDADITLDLRAALDITYDASRYSPRIYRGGPDTIDPPLEGDLAAWARNLIPTQPTGA
jgi:hypothetical protein